MGSLGIVVAVLLFVALEPCKACMYVQTDAQGFVERMEQAPVVFRGKVSGIQQDSGPRGRGFYDATFDVECVYKSSPDAVTPTVGKSVTVIRFGDDGAQCSSAWVEQDNTYLVLAYFDEYREKIRVMNVNFQSGAEGATQALIDQVEGPGPEQYTCISPSK